MERKSETIYWSRLANSKWQLVVAATERGLCYVGGQHESFDQLSEWAAHRFPACELQCDDVHLQPYMDEILEYLEGTRDRFTMPVDVQGTPFQRTVWSVLCQIPYGETRTYSEIAHQLQKPTASRAVGGAIGANPILITVPCHRVIGKDGSITGYRGGLDMKRMLLQIEKSQSIN